MKIYTFNEQKESSDYIIQKQFGEKKKEIEKEFNNPNSELNELDFQYFKWSNSELYTIFLGTFSFIENDVEYIMEIIIDCEKIEDNDIGEIDLVFKGYVNSELQKTIDKKIPNENFNKDIILTLINEYKTENDKN